MVIYVQCLENQREVPRRVDRVRRRRVLNTIWRDLLCCAGTMVCHLAPRQNIRQSFIFASFFTSTDVSPKFLKRKQTGGVSPPPRLRPRLTSLPSSLPLLTSFHKLSSPQPPPSARPRHLFPLHLPLFLPWRSLVLTGPCRGRRPSPCWWVAS